MRLLTPGRSQEGWAMKKRCTGDGNGGGGCGALLLVEEADIFHTESYARDEMTRYATFMCSECGVLTDFDDGEVPSHVWDRAPSQKAWKERHGV